MNNMGYGKIVGPLGNLLLAHRAAWAMENGPIPPGMQLNHACDNPLCIRPDHLFVADPRRMAPSL